MKIQFCSDLHIEMRPFGYRLTRTDADVIVLAGDIATGINTIEFAIEEAELQNKPVIVVAGNHEFYRGDYYYVLNEMRSAASQHPLVHLLENSEIVIDGVRFLGCTLWTDYEVNGEQNKAIDMAYCGRMLRDYVVIRNGDFNFTPRDAEELCRISKLFLAQKLGAKFNAPSVVVTHHGPSLECQHKSYKMSEISAAFTSNFDDLVTQPDLWVYGHTHSNLDIKVGNCRLVSNQQGYPNEEIPIPFRSDWVIEV